MSSMIKNIKLLVRQLIALTTYMTGFSLLLLKGKVVILTYHRILAEKDLAQNYVQPGMYVYSNVFEMHVRILKKHFQILTLQELIELWKSNNCNKEKRYCVITFDDGWVDNYRNAFPLLRKYDVPATIFLPSQLIGSDTLPWPDKLVSLLWRYYRTDSGLDQHVSALKKYQWLLSGQGTSIEEMIERLIEKVKQMPYSEIDTIINDLQGELGIPAHEERALLNWEEIEEMSRYGISFGSHSCTHKVLTMLSSEEVKREITESHSMLGSKRINYVPIFCYPNGNYNRHIAEQLKVTGYQAAVSTDFGLESSVPDNLFALRRIGIHNDICRTLPLFAYRLSGIASWGTRPW
jgi:peptidoglycan/xylan/chitin deacetylase (PgdA/CDA1 family)